MALPLNPALFFSSSCIIPPNSISTPIFLHPFPYLHSTCILSKIILLIAYIAPPLLKRVYVTLAVLELCKPGWPQMHKDLPASTSQVLGLKAYKIMPRGCTFLISLSEN